MVSSQTTTNEYSLFQSFVYSSFASYSSGV